MSDVYIAGSLRHASRDHWKFYEKIADVVSNFGLKPHVPHIHTASEINFNLDDLHNPNLDDSMRVVAFNKNKEAVKKCKLLIAEVSNPSTGTGVEIGLAMNLNKPIICIADKNANLTSMVTGPANLKSLDLIIYENKEDGLKKLEELLNKKYKYLIDSKT